MMVRDDLATWLRVRDTVPWSSACPSLPAPVTGDRDGVAHFINTAHRARDPQRADRLLTALDRSRADAAAGCELSFSLMTTWQHDVLGASHLTFRKTAAYAKQGRERYGLDQDTPARFDVCLRQATHQPDIPLAARAARAYLDVCFFHPFPDGNSRAALLVLDFILTREHMTLDYAAPVFVVARRADDTDGAIAFARLIHHLATTTERTA